MLEVAMWFRCMAMLLLALVLGSVLMLQWLDGCREGRQRRGGSPRQRIEQPRL